MLARSARRRYTLDEYLRLEEYSNIRHEFIDGEILAMAGGTLEHGEYAANVIHLLRLGLEGRPCHVYTSDVRVLVRATNLDTYPDVSVVRGRAERDVTDGQALANPSVLVEVTSPSSNDYDRGEKLANYKLIPSLREVVLVAHDVRRVDVVRRLPDGSWSTTEAGSGGSIRLESLGLDLAVDQIYRSPGANA